MTRGVCWRIAITAGLVALSHAGCATTAVTSMPESPSEVPRLAGFWTAVDEAVATATPALHQRGERQHLVGFGENDAGPFSFSFGR